MSRVRQPPRLGVCSWSLRPTGPAELVAAVAATGLAAVQLALKPFHGGGILGRGGWPLRETAQRLRDAGIALRSAMFATRGEDYSTLATIAATGGLASDELWPANLALARADARRCRQLGLSLVTFHAGVLPGPADAARHDLLLTRLGQVVDVFAGEGVAVGLETGQEEPRTLLDALARLARPSLGVNFDAANMLLYGAGEPDAALALLLPHVVQVHVKDSRPPRRPGEWGEEVVVGTGEVDWPALLDRLGQAGRPLDLLVEREAGEQRVEDVRAAVRCLRPLLAARPGLGHA